MKKIMVVSFFLLLLGVCIADAILTNQTFNKLKTFSNDLCETLEVAESRTDEIDQKVAIFENYWEKRQKILTIFIRHEETKIVGEKLTFVKSLIENDNVEEARTEVYVLREQIETLAKTYSFTLDNIF